MARDTVDGHDVFKVRASVNDAVRRARDKRQPTLIEARTYRYRGHSMADPGTYRTKDQVDEWKSRDPILTLGQKMDTLGLQAAREQIESDIEIEMADAVRFAEESNMPAPETAGQYVMA
jgi:pyruvate dehydrogenase E1 component alpha subunit